MNNNEKMFDWYDDVEDSVPIEEFRGDDKSDVTQSDVSGSSQSNLSRYSADRDPMADSQHRESELLNLLSVSGFSMTQINGQRKLGPPPGWTQPPPDPNCEVFVGKIPRDLYEHEIYPIFEKIGQIYEIRLMMDFSGTNRGYCFVMFTKFEQAQRAVRELNNYEIRAGRRIGVVASINNCRLSIDKLPADVEPELVMKKFYETTDEVSKVAVYKNMNGKVCRAIVSYKTHRGAAMARRRLLPERGNLFANAEVSVDWAHPEMSINNAVAEIGFLDEEGKLQIRSEKITQYQKRGGPQRKGRDFLDASLDNYLRDKSSGWSDNRCRSPERSSSARGHRVSGRGYSIPPRRRSGRDFYQQKRSSNLGPQGRGSSREIVEVKSRRQYRSRSIEPASLENHCIAKNPPHPASRDINGNITKSTNIQLNLAASKNENYGVRDVVLTDSSIIRAQGIAPIAENRISIDSFNLFEQYSLSPRENYADKAPQKSYAPFQGATCWSGSVQDFFCNHGIRSDADVRKNLYHLPSDNEKSVNFPEFDQWNSTESFALKSVAFASTKPNDIEIGQNEINDDFKKINISFRPTGRNPRKNGKNPFGNGIRQRNGSCALTPISNSDSYYNSSQGIAPRRFQNFDKNPTNSSMKENKFNRYEIQRPTTTAAFSQRCGENRFQRMNLFTRYQRKLPSSGGAPVEPQNKPIPNHPGYWTTSNNGGESHIAIANRSIAGPLNLALRNYYCDTPAPVNFGRAVCLRVNSDLNQIAHRPRPILNRLAGRISEDQ